MSEAQNQPSLKEVKNPLISKIKDAAIIKDAALLLGWIAAIILIAGFSWSFVNSHRNRSLQRSVNRVLEQSGYEYRLGEPVYTRVFNTGLGTMYELTGRYGNEVYPGARIFIFTIIAEGYFFPCAALITPIGEVQEIIPLGSHAQRKLRQVTPGIMQIYTRRIEGIGL